MVRAFDVLEHLIGLDHEHLADVNRVVRPALCLMDATVGLEGNGPKSGRPRITDRILGSTDPVALDTIQSVIMGVDPARVHHLRTCAARAWDHCGPYTGWASTPRQARRAWSAVQPR